jgi:hypothetical protein
MSTDTPKSLYLLRNGSRLSVSYLHLGTGRCKFMGLKSTICLKPPVVLGSNRLADTQGVGPGTALTAPSVISFGSKSFSQYWSSSGDHWGLWKWKGGGDWRNGNVMPWLIHWRSSGLAPVLAQNFSLALTGNYSPLLFQPSSGRVCETGRHSVEA